MGYGQVSRPEGRRQKLGVSPLPSDFRLLTCALPEREFVIKLPFSFGLRPSKFSL